MRTREEEHVSFVFTNNIVYFDSGDLLGSNWKNGKFTSDIQCLFRRAIRRFGGDDEVCGRRPGRMAPARARPAFT